MAAPMMDEHISRSGKRESDLVALDGRECVALAYQWRWAPSTTTGFDILLSTAMVRGTFGYQTPESIDRYWSDEERVCACACYSLCLPQLKTSATNFDVSRTGGIIDLEHSYGEERGAALERTIADVLLWDLSTISPHAGGPHRSAEEQLTGEGSEQNSPIILLQGPLLPKLRGRLYYRFISAEVPLFCITYQPDKLARLVSRKVLQEEEACPPDSTGELHWSGPLPSLSLDAGSRVFMGWKEGRIRFHVELPANTWDPSLGSEWWQQRRRLCAQLFERTGATGKRAEDKRDPFRKLLPAPLAEARRRAKDRLDEDFEQEVAVASYSELYEAAGIRYPSAQHTTNEIAWAHQMNTIILGINSAAKLGHKMQEGHDPDLPRLQLAQLKAKFYEAMNDPEKKTELRLLIKKNSHLSTS